MKPHITEQKPVSVVRIQKQKEKVNLSPMFIGKIYSLGSLKDIEDGITFRIRNPMRDTLLTGVLDLAINTIKIPLDKVILMSHDTRKRACEVNEQNPFPFFIGEGVDLVIPRWTLDKNTTHKITFSFSTDLYGKIDLWVKDSVQENTPQICRIPCERTADCSPDIVRQRQDFVEGFTGIKLRHLTRYSFDPELAKGNIENFTGIAQIPLGFAGPLRVNGEHAKGEFLIPLCTSEGTLVASYNRGMKIINMCGGVCTTVVHESMQRAPAFVFDSAREARNFTIWVDEHMEDIRVHAESTSRHAKLLNVEKYLVGRFVYLRFNYSTGDAAGQNMVSMASFVSCNWILSQVNSVRHFYMDANLATDKKSSLINMLHTRGKRVIAEMVIPREIMIQHMRVDPETLDHLCRVGCLGAFMAGASNNGLHAANALAALFMATGQDVANIAESSAGIIYTEVTPEGNLYGSLTLPSLIVATVGGGTNLPTQRECLEILGCYGPGKALKYSEIVTAVVAAGEISLAGALSSLDWVASHERCRKKTWRCHE